LSLLWSDVDGPVNLGEADEHSVLKVANHVIEHTNSPSSIIHLGPADDDPRIRRPSIERARQLLGWEPRTTLRQGISATVRDLEARLEAGESSIGIHRAAPPGTSAQMEMALVPGANPCSRAEDSAPLETAWAAGARAVRPPL